MRNRFWLGPVSRAAIGAAVSALCQQIQTDELERGLAGASEDIRLSLTACILGSQNRFEIAEAGAQRLRELGLLACCDPESTKSHLLAISTFRRALSTPKQAVRVRFPNRSADLIVGALNRVPLLEAVLAHERRSPTPGLSARQAMIDIIPGVGPKQSSLFLRRIGYSTDLAVIDRHVISYLALMYGFAIAVPRLANLEYYCGVESRIAVIASALGSSVGCFDLAVWVTMRVAREEHLL